MSSDSTRPNATPRDARDASAPGHVAAREEPARRLPFHTEGLVRRELLDGGELLYVPAFFDRETANALFTALRDGIPWEHVRIRGVPQRLATYWIGSVAYEYSRQVRPAAPWLPVPRAIGAAVESVLFGETGETFEGALLNHYQDGETKLGFHADNEPIIVPDSPIASVSLGATRRFVLRHNATGATRELTLGHGSLLVMQGTTQRFWQHAVPPERGVGPRINLTFRRCRPVPPSK